jgi:hypothetical protein
MHVKGRGIAAQHVVVNGGDLKPAFDQPGEHRIDLGFEQHQVAHRHNAAMGGLHGDPAAERQSRFDGDAVQGHGQISARKAVAVYIAGNRRGFAAEGGIDFIPIDLLRLSLNLGDR